MYVYFNKYILLMNTICIFCGGKCCVLICAVIARLYGTSMFWSFFLLGWMVMLPNYFLGFETGQEKIWVFSTLTRLHMYWNAWMYFSILFLFSYKEDLVILSIEVTWELDLNVRSNWALSSRHTRRMCPKVFLPTFHLP